MEVDDEMTPAVRVTYKSIAILTHNTDLYMFIGIKACIYGWHGIL